LPAAGWLARIAQLPTELNVITPPLVTEHAVLEVEYVTGWPEVAVARGVGGVLVNDVFDNAGNVITSVPAVTVKLTVTGLAAL
jgi:hypothetical protein